MEAIKTFSKIQFENEQDSSDAERYLDNFSEEREHESITYRHEEALDEDLNATMKAFAKTPKGTSLALVGAAKNIKIVAPKAGLKRAYLPNRSLIFSLSSVICVLIKASHLLASPLCWLFWCSGWRDGFNCGYGDHERHE